MKFPLFLTLFVVLGFGPAIALAVLDIRNTAKIEEIRSKERIELARIAADAAAVNRSR